MMFLFPDTATPQIYTLSLHDALPISSPWMTRVGTVMPGSTSSMFQARKSGSNQTRFHPQNATSVLSPWWRARRSRRSEEHTSELQSQSNLVCRLLLEKKKKKIDT